MSYLNDVAKLAHDQIVKYPTLRIGQAYYNALYNYDREQANRITNTSLDPFNDYKNMGAFMEMLLNKGNSLTKIQS